MSYDANSAYPTGPGAAAPGGPGFGAAPRGAASPEDLSLPLYGASFGQAVKRFFKKYAKFTGRASRSEFWYVYLFIFLVTLIPTILYSIGIVMTMTAAMAASDPYNMQAAAAPSGGAIALTAIGGILLLIFSLAIIVPYLAIIVRRLHDANFPWPFIFLGLIPVVLIVLMILPSKPEGQRFDV